MKMTAALFVLVCLVVATPVQAQEDDHRPAKEIRRESSSISAAANRAVLRLATQPNATGQRQNRMGRRLIGWMWIGSGLGLAGAVAVSDSFSPSEKKLWGGGGLAVMGSVGAYFLATADLTPGVSVAPTRGGVAVFRGFTF